MGLNGMSTHVLSMYERSRERNVNTLLAVRVSKLSTSIDLAFCNKVRVNYERKSDNTVTYGPCKSSS